ncbi:MAG TPA: hypothetical protein VEL47_04075 [Myxococcota bacterium]|nr:hypothetical protein [Myxococcota bacterium]
MRNKLCMVLALLSCCVLSLTQSCHPESPSFEHQDSKVEEEEAELDDPAIPEAPVTVPVSVPTVTAPELLPSEPPPALPLPPAPLAPWGGGGGGGGGGHGGHDDAEDHRHRNECGERVDCKNPACEGRPCNDHDGCTQDSKCIDSECRAKTDNPCDKEIHNECVLTTCHSTGDHSFYCSFELDPDKTSAGSCTPEHNCSKRNHDGTCDDRHLIDQCILGRCVLEELCPVDEQPPIVCEEQNRSTLPLGICSGGSNDGNDCVDIERSSDCPGGTCEPQGGCVDTNPCTADSCLSVSKGKDHDYQCHYETLLMIPCNTDNPCDISECQLVNGSPTCVMTDIAIKCPAANQCTGVQLGGGAFYGLCDADAQCISQPLANGPTCIDGSSCPSGECFGAVLGSCSDGSGPCYYAEQCTEFPEATCSGSLGTCACDTGNPCVIGLCDDAGDCLPTTPASEGTGCSDGITCHTGTCNGSGVCEIVLHDDQCEPESCHNPCVVPTCTETGCDNLYINGKISCSVTVDGHGTCQGTADCVDGVGECVPNQPLNCES